jgi:hypothetical protein
VGIQGGRGDDEGLKEKGGMKQNSRRIEGGRGNEG